MLDIIRHGRSLGHRKGLVRTDHTERAVSLESSLDERFGHGFGRFRFGMSTKEVNALLDRPFGSVDPARLPVAREYTTGDVRYFWLPISGSSEFRDFFNLGQGCLEDRDYLVFMFYEDSLMRISYRLNGREKPGCLARNALFPELARRHAMPLLGTPKQWRLQWETKRVSIVGATLGDGPMLDIVAR
jgi:hypothetical protein